LNNPIGGSPDSCLPHTHDGPAAGLQLFVVSAVTSHVGLDLWDPVIRIATFGQTRFPFHPARGPPQTELAMEPLGPGGVNAGGKADEAAQLLP